MSVCETDRQTDADRHCVCACACLCVCACVCEASRYLNPNARLEFGSVKELTAQILPKPCFIPHFAHRPDRTTVVLCAS